MPFKGLIASTIATGPIAMRSQQKRGSRVFWGVEGEAAEELGDGRGQIYRMVKRATDVRERHVRCDCCRSRDAVMR